MNYSFNIINEGSIIISINYVEKQIFAYIINFCFYNYKILTNKRKFCTYKLKN